MKLRRIEVRDFRKLRHALVEGLGDGLNVVVGDNEAGKSTLLAALRAALFERHRVTGEAVAAMLPYGQNVRPEVEVDFEFGGASYRLRKAFNQKPEALLIGNGGQWANDAADEQLAVLFGFSPPGRGASRPVEHHGIYGLLWVEQGTAHSALGIGAGRNQLAAALEREVGEVTGGERGRALLAAAEARRNEFWDRRDSPRGAFKALAAELEAARLRRDDIARRLAELDGKVEQLATIDATLARHSQNDTLTTARAGLEAARLAEERIAGLEAAAQQAEGELERAELRNEAAAQKRTARSALIAQSGKAATALASAQQAASEAASLLSRLELAGMGAVAEAEAARLRQREAGTRLQQLEARRSAQQAGLQLQRLAAQLTVAEAADAARRDAAAIVSGETLTRDQLATLEALAETAQRERLRLEAASVRITLAPINGQLAQLDGAPLAGDEVTLSRDAVLDLAGYGRIIIHPGGGMAPLAAAVAAADTRLRDTLAQCRQADLATARASLARKLTATAEVALQDKSLQSLAPEGLAALRQELDALRARAGSSADLPVDEVQAATARQALDTGSSAAEEFERTAQRALAATMAARTELAVSGERLARCETDYARLRDELMVARATNPDSALDDDLLSTGTILAAAEAHAAASRQAVIDADPATARLAFTRATQAVRAIHDDITALERKRSDFRVELSTLGKDGLGEQLAEIGEQIAHAEKILRSRTLEAAAARLLHETLAAAQRETKERWLAPVRERSAPYLRLISANSTIALNEATLELDQVTRDGVSEPFEGLSVGAREQIAVITRLVLADILREAGQSSSVVLDDALVNTDQARLERMHLVLHRAAEHQQILILTCRERDFLQLGAPIRRM